MKPTLAPFPHRLFTVRSALPTDAEAFHEGFQELLVDDIVFDDEDIDGRYRAFNKATKGSVWRLAVAGLLRLRGTRARRGNTRWRRVRLGLGRLGRRTRWRRDLGRCYGRLRTRGHIRVYI